MPRSETHIRIGSKMVDEIAALHRLREGGGIEEITFDDPEVRRCCSAVEEGSLAGGKVVIPDNLVSLAQQPIDKITADESRCTGPF
jgi:hypothetical protein